MKQLHQNIKTGENVKGRKNNQGTKYYKVQYRDYLVRREKIKN